MAWTREFFARPAAAAFDSFKFLAIFSPASRSDARGQCQKVWAALLQTRQSLPSGGAFVPGPAGAASATLVPEAKAATLAFFSLTF